MPYIMKMYVDGGCRRNGYSDAIGAAACVIYMRGGRTKTWTRAIPPDEHPTNQRAEITAIILALEQALAKYDKLHSAPYLEVTIYTDSKYAHGWMSTWRYHAWKYPWVNSQGNAVANADLIKEAFKLHEAVRELGDVQYVKIPRSQNSEAREATDSVMDLMDELSGYNPGWFYKVWIGCRFDSAWGLLTAWRDVVVRVGKQLPGT